MNINEMTPIFDYSKASIDLENLKHQRDLTINEREANKTFWTERVKRLFFSSSLEPIVAIQRIFLSCILFFSPSERKYKKELKEIDVKIDLNNKLVLKKLEDIKLMFNITSDKKFEITRAIGFKIIDLACGTFESIPQIPSNEVWQDGGNIVDVTHNYVGIRRFEHQGRRGLVIFNDYPCDTGSLPQKEIFYEQDSSMGSVCWTQTIKSKRGEIENGKVKWSDKTIWKLIDEGRITEEAYQELRQRICTAKEKLNSFKTLATTVAPDLDNIDFLI